MINIEDTAAGRNNLSSNFKTVRIDITDRRRPSFQGSEKGAKKYSQLEYLKNDTPQILSDDKQPKATFKARQLFSE